MTIAARPWAAAYPSGVPAEVTAPLARTLGQLVRDTAAREGDRTAYTVVMPNGMYGDLSFAEVDRLSDAFAAWLREVAGLQPGDRVALQTPNSLTVPVVAFGTFKAGCVLVNVNPLYTATEMAHQIADAQPKVIVITDMFTDKLAEAGRIVPLPRVVVTRVAELMPRAVRGVIGLVQKHWDRSIPAITLPHTRLPETLAEGARLPRKAYDADLSETAIAVLQYTGGTTGVAKGAILTHRNLLMNMAQAMTFINPHVAPGKEVVLTAIPTYHILAFTLNLLGFFHLGARNLLIPNPRPLSNLKRAFENYPITWIIGVNTLFNGLMNEYWFTTAPPRRLKASFAGGMALHGAVADRWRALTGTEIVEGYGLTETSPVATGNPIGAARPGSIGIPMPSTDVRLLDDEGRDVPPGSPGEFAIRGPQVMQGYWNRPAETAAAICPEGFLRTGDIAVMDTDGYFRIVDRKKDMILVSGFNVYPNEVEDCLARHAAVQECAVIGVPDGAAGEFVRAYVVRRDPAVTEADLRAHCKTSLTAYKVPRQVVFRDELPKTNVGKILRRSLRDEALSQMKGE
ncbi:MAG: AMP-binding protein [Rhodobacteraceae bacterium]|nr:AMP-binding protein [Paracoccaceae bacterium]